MEESIKVGSLGGVKGKLGESVSLTLEGGVILVTVQNDASSKRQLKYLLRRYIRKQNLSDYLRVIAPAHDTYQIKYLASAVGEQEEEGEDVE